MINYDEYRNIIEKAIEFDKNVLNNLAPNNAKLLEQDLDTDIQVRYEQWNYNKHLKYPTFVINVMDIKKKHNKFTFSIDFMNQFYDYNPIIDCLINTPEGFWDLVGSWKTFTKLAYGEADEWSDIGGPL